MVLKVYIKMKKFILKVCIQMKEKVNQYSIAYLMVAATKSSTYLYQKEEIGCLPDLSLYKSELEKKKMSWAITIGCCEVPIMYSLQTHLMTLVLQDSFLAHREAKLKVLIYLFTKYITHIGLQCKIINRHNVRLRKNQPNLKAESCMCVVCSGFHRTREKGEKKEAML